METPDISRDILAAIYEVGKRHGVHDFNVSEQATRALVDGIARAVMALAIAADGKVTAVLAHTSAGDGKVAVSVRRGKNEWQEIVIDDEEETRP